MSVDRRNRAERQEAQRARYETIDHLDGLVILLHAVAFALQDGDMTPTEAHLFVLEVLDHA